MADSKTKLKLFDKVELVPWNDLVPAEYNPRRMSHRKRSELRLSMMKFGFTVPMIVDRKSMTVIGGHQRLGVIQEMVEEGVVAKGQRVPVIFRDDLSEADVRKLNVGLNEIEGEFDASSLAALIESIETLDGGVILDLGSMGLTDDDLLALREATTVPESLLRDMQDRSDPSNIQHDVRVEPVKAYRLTVPVPVATEIIEPALKAFGHSGLAIMAANAGVPTFDTTSAAVAAGLKFALSRLEFRDVFPEEAPEAVAVADAVPTAAKDRPRRPRKPRNGASS